MILKATTELLTNYFRFGHILFWKISIRIQLIVCMAVTKIFMRPFKFNGIVKNT